jgi:hypothetical protein
MNGAGPFVHDPLDGVSAAAALGAASEAGIESLMRGRRASFATTDRTCCSLNTLQEQTIISAPSQALRKSDDDIAKID